MPAVAKEIIWEVQDRVNDGVIPIDTLASVAQLLKEHRVEVGLRKPDPPRRRFGASAPQLNYWNVFQENVLGSGNKRVLVASGANQCTVGDTVIESPDGGRRIDSIVGEHVVYAWDGEKKVSAKANAPFVKGYEMCYRYYLSNGQSIGCSDEHRFLGADGLWHHAGDLRRAFLQQRAASLASHRKWACEQDCEEVPPFSVSSQASIDPAPPSIFEPCHPLTILDICRLARAEGGRRSTRTAQDSLGGYRRSRRSCDEQPRSELGIAQDASPLPSDVLERNDRLWHMGVLGNTPAHTHPCRVSDHLSSRGALDQIAAQFSGTRSHAVYKLSILSDGHSSVGRRSTSGFCLPRSMCGFDRQATDERYTGLPLLMSPDGVTSIVACEPIGFHHIYDFEVPVYHNYFAAGVISHNSGKTWIVSACFCTFLRDHAKNGDVFWVIAQSYQTLKDVPFKSIYDCLPASMFPKGREKYDPSVHEIQPMVMNLPDNRGTCEVWFKSEDQGIEKFESSRLRGIWWTECGSQALYEALLPRMLARGGFMLCDLIPFHGWHRSVLREKAAIPNSPIHYEKFTVMDNAHNLAEGAVERMKSMMSKKMWEIRGLGKEAASQGAVFQNFDPDIHTVDPFRVPDWWPLYMSADWGFNAPHCFALYTVSPNETIYVVAEHYEAQMSVFDTCVAAWEMVSAVRPLTLYPGCANAGDMFDAMRKIDFRKRSVVQDEFMAEIQEQSGNPIRDHISSEFNRVLVGGCSIDNQVFQRHGSAATLAQEFWRAGLPVRAAVKRSVDSTVETMRRLFDANRLILFKTCYKIREDLVSYSYKQGRDMSVLDADKYEHKNSHGPDCLRYGIQMNMTHQSIQDAIGV